MIRSEPDFTHFGNTFITFGTWFGYVRNVLLLLVNVPSRQNDKRSRRRNQSPIIFTSTRLRRLPSNSP